MDYQYKIIISNRNVYKEFELMADMDKVRIGTTSGCEFRLNQDSFFDCIELILEKKNGEWEMSASDSVYISRGDMRKILSTRLVHGDSISIRYAKSLKEAFELRFMIDFEAETPSYNWKINIVPISELTIGNDETDDIVIHSEFDSIIEIELVRREDKIWIREKSSAYGLYVNGKKTNGETSINNYDFFSVAEFSFFYLNQELYFDKKNVHTINLQVTPLMKKVNDFRYPLFNRNTRIQTRLSTETIQILDAPDKPEKPKNNIVLSLLPTVVMLALIILLRVFMNTSSGLYIVISICSMGMGIVTSIIGIISGKKEYRKSIEDRQTKYSEYIEKKKSEIAEARQIEKDNLEKIYFDINHDIEIVENFDSHLFERTTEDEDFLAVYLGKGRIKAKRVIDYKRKEKLEVGDELSSLPERLCEIFEYIENAPITVNIKDANAVGIVGKNEFLYNIFKNVLVDIAVRQYYGDVKIFILVDDVEKYDWVRLLPHVFQENGLRNIVSDNASKNNIFEMLYRELCDRESKKGCYEHFVIFVMNEYGIKNHPISKFISKASELNATFVFFEKCLEKLPLNCKEIIMLDSEYEGRVLQSDGETNIDYFVYETISDASAKSVVKKLAPIYCEEINLENSLRKNISLYELLHIYEAGDLDLKSRWETSQVYLSMETPIGINAKDETVYLNLHEKFHGPHGLVAGTTGSGKSEILQTFILSAATLYHPYEIGFVIIDFKGGGMVNQFRELPHLVGAITNIDGNEVKRSLKSIKAELLKRQSLFAEADVNHIDKYLRLYRLGKVQVALPHLIIIVDEFAELKAEQPDFMKELISTARIGRSLGVHLILATQKPSGVVDAQIWSNSRFKLCLKVQSQEDSNEVLKTPLAAEIKEPGRAYLQVGNNEIFELFQSAYSGATATIDEGTNTKAFRINKLNLLGIKKPLFVAGEKKEELANNRTQLEALVEYIKDYCKERNIKKLPDICMPPLPSILSYEARREEKESEVGVRAIVGLMDDPDNQSQDNLTLEITGQNIFIIGSAQTGKTNVLQTIIRSVTEKYSPYELNIYIIDFGTMILRNFGELNHVGGVVCFSEDERMKNLLKLLDSEIKSRKELFASAGVSSYAAYLETGEKLIPQIMVFIDNFTAVKETYMPGTDIFLPLFRDGISVGISFIVTNNITNGIGYRYLNNFETRIALFCNDVTEYSTLFEGCRTQQSNVQGRGLVGLNKHVLTCQFFLAFNGEKEIDRVQSIRNYVENKNRIYDGMRAKIIPEIPESVSESYIKENFNQMCNKNQIIIGLDYDNIAPVFIDLQKDSILALSGKKEMERDYFSHYMVDRIINNEECAVEMYIIDDGKRKWGNYKQHKNTVRYSVLPEDSLQHIVEIEQKLAERYEEIANGSTDSLQEKPWIILIIENQNAISMLATDKQIVECYKNIVGKYKEMKIFILFSNIDNLSITFNANEILKSIKESKKFIVFDEISNIKLFEVSTSIAKKYPKQNSPDDVFFYTENSILKVKIVSSDGILQ